MKRILYLFVMLLLVQNLAFSQGATFSTNELISRVNFGTPPFDASDLMSPPSGISNSPCTGYSDFTFGNALLGDGNTSNAVYTMGVAKTQTYQLEVEGGYCGSSLNIANATRAIRVFVDFNADNDFLDIGEMVYLSPSLASNTPVFNTPVTIPDNAASGEITMRIVYTRVNGSSGTNFFWGLDWIDWATFAYSYGETEDYTLVVTAYIDSIQSFNTSCSNTADGQIIITPDVSANPNNEYSINGTAGPWSTDLVYNNLAPGIYTVAARDPNLDPDNVYEEYEVEILAASAIVVDANITSDFNGEAISCAGISDGEITLSASGGEGSSYSFEYFSVLDPTITSTTAVLSGLATDTFSFIAIDDLGCTSDTLEFFLAEPSPISIDNVLITSDISCDGVCDAELTIEASGGTMPYFYQVNGVSFGNNNTATGVCAGSPSVMVTDDNGCSLLLNTFVSSPSPVVLNLQALSNFNNYEISCDGNSDGVLEWSVTGGLGSYELSIDNGLSFPYPSAALDTLFNLSSGTYNIIARDSNQCQTPVQIISLNAPPALSFNSIDITSTISCNGFADGQITVQATGGVNPYLYSLDNGLNNQQSTVFNGLSSSNYTFTVTDDNGCTFQDNLFLWQPDVLILNAIDVISDYNGSQISCYQASDGIIELDISGGTQGFNYSFLPDFTLNPLNFNDQISNLSAGVYSLQITDANQCVSNPMDVEILSPQELLISSVAFSPVNCFGFSDGQITVVGSGGTGNYSYFVDALYNSGNQLPFTVSGLSSSNYAIVMSDENACLSQVVNQFLPQPTPLVSNLGVVNLGCSGELYGSALVNPSGGVPGYSISWSNGATTDSVNQLLTGDYLVTITDANNCQLIENFDITEPSIDLNVTDVLCHGLSTGQIEAILNNPAPTSNFTVLWNDANAQTTLTALSLPAGDYTVSMTDQFGCVLTASETISEPDTLSVYVEHSHLCEDNPIASALVFPSGGVTPYAYLWNTNETSELISISNPGSYAIEVTDDNGCQQNVAITIDPIVPIELDFVISPVSCVDNNDGSVEVFVLAGHAPYTYYWTNYSDSATNSNITSGAYGVTVTDDHQCTTYSEVLLPANDDPCINVYSAFSPNGDQNNDYWHIDNIELYPDALVEVFNRWGDRVFATKKYINAWEGAWQGMYNEQILPSATYYYAITLNNGQEPLVGTVTIVR